MKMSISPPRASRTGSRLKPPKPLMLASLALVLFAAPSQAKTFIVVEENRSYSQVIGNDNMPFFNSLARSNARATGYYAVTHPSIGNYFSLTTGKIITNNDRYDGTVYTDNIIRHIIAKGKTWKEYSEDLPYVGYFGGNKGYYTQHHNPCSYFSDVRLDPKQAKNLVPFEQLEIDINNGALPNFGFIVPSDAHNGHDGSLATADRWLKENISTLIAALDYNDLLIITWDESDKGDEAYGGGHIAWVAVGGVKKSYRSETFYQHPNTLRLMCDSLGISCPISVKSMMEFLR
jgi:hypothetical protein